MWWNNRVVQILLAVCVIVAICIIAGMHLDFQAGSNGINLGVVRSK